jgi:uncharacterized membrane protein
MKTISRLAFAASMIGLGVIGLIVGDFANVWQQVPAAMPGYTILAYACAVVSLLGGLGLLIPRAAPMASRVLLVYLILWLVLIRVTGVIAAPLVEDRWSGLGENSVLVAGALVLFAWLNPQSPIAARSLTVARYLFALGVTPVGLSHLVYAHGATAFVPRWLPFRLQLVVFTGVAHIAAGLAVLFNVVPRLAAYLEAAMITSFTLLTWIPDVPGGTPVFHWTAFFISFAIGNAALLVAASLSAIV